MSTFPVLIGLLSAVLGVMVAYRLTIGAQINRSRRAQHMSVVSGQRLRSESVTVTRAPRTMRDRLRAAGLDWGPNAESLFRLSRIGTALVVALFVLLFGMPPVIALAAAAGGYGYLGAWLAGQERSRTLAIEKELPDALGDLVAVLRVTGSLRQALDQTRGLILQSRPKSPLAQELQWTLEDMQTDDAGAFTDLAKRTSSSALAMLAFALGVFVKSGGDYVTALEAQARGVRLTLEARAEAQASSSEAMMAVRIIPGILAIVTFIFMQDPYFHSFYFSQLGQILIACVLALMAGGYKWVQSMINEVA